MHTCTRRHSAVTTRFCPDCGKEITPLRITDTEGLRNIAFNLGVSPDWHEPDEQGVTARVLGHSFDNTGCWPVENTSEHLSSTSGALEMYVELIKDHKVVAHVNLATLFAMACMDGDYR
jgi:hypothetical protein